MRKTSVAILTFLLTLLGELAFTPLLPLDLMVTSATSDTDSLRLITVTLEVRDYDGAALQEASVRSFSEDYGTRVPSVGFNKTNPQGRLTVRLMNGTWSFFAYGGDRYAYTRPGHGYFMCLLKQNLQADTSLFLQPNETTSVSFYDLNGTPLDGKVSVMESNHTPTVTTDIAGKTLNGKMTIHSPRNLEISVFSQHLGPSSGYVFLRKVSAGYATSIKAVGSEMTKMDLNTRGLNKETSFGTYFINYDSFDVGDTTWLHPIEVAVDGNYVLYSTPTLVTVTATLKQGWDFWHSVPEDYQLAEGSVLTLQRGGPIDVTVRTMKEGTQIWIDVRDSYGNLYMNSWSVSVPIRLVKGNETIFTGDLKGFTGLLEKTYDTSDSPTYEITLDLKAYGVHVLVGKLLTSSSMLQFRTVITEHFNFSLPDVGGKIADRFNTMSSIFEQIYEAQSRTLGRKLTEKVRMEFSIFPHSAGYAGTNYVHMGIGFSLDMSYRTIPSNFIDVAGHELGHVFQLSPPFSPPGWNIAYQFGEPSASWLSVRAIQSILSKNQALWQKGGLSENFYLDLLRGTPTSSQIVGNIQFVMFHLEKWYGQEVLRDFVNLWVFKDAGTILRNRGFNTNESVVSVFSTVVKQNLAPVFRQTGLNVGDTRIAEGMQIAYQLHKTPSAISCKLSSYENFVGKLIVVSGIIEPHLAEKRVSLTYVKPDGSLTIRNSITDQAGSFNDTCVSDLAGSWTVQASWEGDSVFTGASSFILHFVVSPSPTPSPPPSSSPTPSPTPTATITPSPIPLPMPTISPTPSSTPTPTSQTPSQTPAASQTALNYQMILGALVAVALLAVAIYLIRRRSVPVNTPTL